MPLHRRATAERRRVLASIAFSLWVHAGSAPRAAEAPPPPAGLTDCSALADDVVRLTCYDRLAGRPPAGATPVPAGRTPDVVGQAAADAGGTGLHAIPAGRPSFLSKFWELDAADKRGIFNFTGYRPNFLLPVNTTTRVNKAPSSPTRGVASNNADYQDTEAKFQLSLRTKVAQDIGLPGGDLWLAYTQLSFWQLYNEAGSKPFRATDHEPEAMYVLPIPERLGSLPFSARWRFATLAIAHQSNGQADPLSRSWNRLYAATGFELDDWSLQWRVNRRINESAATDDNPDLLAYRGRHELMLGWTPGHATALLLWRTNFNDLQRGGWQFDWSYPVDASDPRALRWYLQVFSGYAQTLVDYNFRQTSLGVGLSLFEF